MNKALVQEEFGRNATFYATSKVHAKGASLARLVDLVEPQAHWQALDVATAAGHTAFIFAPHVAHVTATDITPEMLPVAAKVAEEKGITNVSFQEADAENLPFEDQRFDLVTCRIAPHHFPDVGRFVAESARVLRPGGILAVVDNVVPGSDESGADGDAVRAAGQYVNDIEKLRDPSHFRCLSVSEWLVAYADAGFELLHQELAPKRMEFEWWARRLGAEDSLVEQLRTMFMDAPATVAEFLMPESADDDLIFYLTEAILVGKI